MLILGLMEHPLEVRRCALTDKFIVYGDMYYHDDTDNIDILAREYVKLKREKQKREFDYTMLNRAKSQKEYQDLLKRAQKDMLYENILKRKVYDNGKVVNSEVLR